MLLDVDLSRTMDEVADARTVVSVYHPFDSDFGGTEPPHLVSGLPEIRHLLSLERHIGSDHILDDDPFLAREFEIAIKDLPQPSSEILVRDWITSWTFDGSWSGCVGETRTFVASLTRGGFIFVVGERLILDFGSHTSGTSVRVHAPHFAKHLLMFIQ